MIRENEKEKESIGDRGVDDRGVAGIGCPINKISPIKEKEVLLCRETPKRLKLIGVKLKRKRRPQLALQLTVNTGVISHTSPYVNNVPSNSVREINRRRTRYLTRGASRGVEYEAAPTDRNTRGPGREHPIYSDISSFAMHR
ncbi:hypothetical protein CDAR_379411 [Caerostris darwini]|uniref:Uncharacterized protein n=1 Tax=Caerostris darwini TaxID=1538125 RepID=A0AAV4VAA8_9ARAC|nr:hypothetical protein CDAR_379411 [Caerostris darwini]